MSSSLYCHVQDDITARAMRDPERKAMKDWRSGLEAGAAVLTQTGVIQDVVTHFQDGGGPLHCHLIDRHGHRHAARLLPVRGAIGMARLSQILETPDGARAGTLAGPRDGVRE